MWAACLYLIGHKCIDYTDLSVCTSESLFMSSHTLVFSVQVLKLWTVSAATVIKKLSPILTPELAVK